MKIVEKTMFIESLVKKFAFILFFMITPLNKWKPNNKSIASEFIKIMKKKAFS